MMRNSCFKLLTWVMGMGISMGAVAQQRGAPPAQQGNPADTEVCEPVPKIVTPGATTAPRRRTRSSSSTDGTSISGSRRKDKSPGGLDRRRRRHDGEQAGRQHRDEAPLHELSNCTRVAGAGEHHRTGQARGNSGVFLASTGEGDAGYELQILDSYNNKTYVNGQAGSIYKQCIPLVNAMRKPGEWQTYDVVWTAPTFNADGSLKTPAYVTAFHNGVLVQNHFELKGETRYIGKPEYTKHGPAPIKLQAHGDPSPPISFRNIWVREL